MPTDIDPEPSEPVKPVEPVDGVEEEGDWVLGADGVWYPPNTTSTRLEAISQTVRETLQAQLEAPRPPVDEAPFVPKTPVITPARLAVKMSEDIEDQDLLRNVERDPLLAASLSPVWREVVDTLRHKQEEAQAAARVGEPTIAALETTAATDVPQAAATKTAKPARRKRLPGSRQQPG